MYSAKQISDPVLNFLKRMRGDGLLMSEVGMSDLIFSFSI